jgi:ferredoxin
MGWRERCTGCARCVLGCPSGAKWDSRHLLDQAVESGAEVVSGHRVREVVIERGRAVGVVALNRGRRQLHRADLVVLAAGGLGTPPILQESKIECRAGLFVDPVLCVATRRERTLQNREIPMPFIVQHEHYIISPYFDFLSYFFNPRWRLPAGDIFSLMIKLADTNEGAVSSKRVRKTLSDVDRARLEEGVKNCKEILRKMGVKEADVFLGTVNAGHPGGMLPLSEREARTLHHGHLPDNLYVADASLFPHSLGNPPILTILALSSRIAGICRELAG